MRVLGFFISIMNIRELGELGMMDLGIERFYFIGEIGNMFIESNFF